MARLIPADVRQALRRLTAAPFLTLGAILTLAIGIGSAVVMVDILDRMLLRAPAHVTDPDRVSRVYLVWPGGSMDHIGYPAYEAVSGLHDEVEAAATYFTEELSLGRGSDARQIQAVAQTLDYFAVLGVQPLLGSWPAASDALNQDRAVIGYGLWQQAFGGAIDVLGKPLRLGMDTVQHRCRRASRVRGHRFQACRRLAPSRAQGESFLFAWMEDAVVLSSGHRASAPRCRATERQPACDGCLSRRPDPIPWRPATGTRSG